MKLLLRALVILLGLAQTVPFAEAVCDSTLILSLPLTATEAPKPIQLGENLVLRTQQSDGGWELQVGWDEDPDGNLLAPIRNWHGAQPFMATAYVADIYPNERVLPIRGTSRALCIRILDAIVKRDGPVPRYAEGTLEIRWVTNHR